MLTRRQLFRFVPAVLAVVLVVVIVVTLVNRRPPELPPIATLASFQDADAPLMMPASGEPDFRFDQFTAWDRLATPLATSFSMPMGSETGALTYDAQPFWELNEKRGGYHTGEDHNGIGGMNTDLGDPVFAVADGLVVFAGEPSPGWGNIVVLNHRLDDGRLLQSLYSHLDRIDVPLGAIVGRGGQVGTVGTANGNYPAHIHFELREAAGVAIAGAYRDVPLESLPPTPTLEHLGLPEGPDLRPATLTIVQTSADLDLGRFEISGDAARMAEILGAAEGGKDENPPEAE